MPERPKTYRPKHAPARTPDRRPTAAQRGYGGDWQRARLSYLAAHPLCVRCLPRVVEATVVDHITPHRGDQGLFWDVSNWQSLCVTCHGRKTATEDRRS